MPQDRIAILIKLGFNAMTIIALGLLALALYLDFYLPMKIDSKVGKSRPHKQSEQNPDKTTTTVIK